jgi:Rps23 Pro-64 3,4-dihydroxylase Tpa1-like proline 4-hydroxylase
VIISLPHKIGCARIAIPSTAVEAERCTSMRAASPSLLTDSRAEILFRILRMSMHEHAFDVESLLNKLISLSFARQIHERFFPGETTQGLSKEVDRFISAAHETTILEIGNAIRFVRSVQIRDFETVREFAVLQAERIGASDAFLFEKFRQLWNRLFARGQFLHHQEATYSKGLHKERTWATIENEEPCLY